MRRLVLLIHLAFLVAGLSASAQAPPANPAPNPPGQGLLEVPPLEVPAVSAALEGQRPAEMESLLEDLLASSLELGLEPPEPEPTPQVPGDRERLEREAFRKLETSGEAPVIALPAGRAYPFGDGVPTLLCVPFRACDVELEAGEVVDGVVVGDPRRWETSFLFEGAGELTPHVLLKPQDFDLATNLVLVTDRRTYHLELRSPPREALEGEGAEYDHHLSWWYPARWARRLRSEAEASAAPAPEVSPVAEALDPQALNFNYATRPARKKSRRLPWEPVTVFDDGRRTFLKLPAAARAAELPVVLGRLEDGSLYPLNARLEESWYIVPAVVGELELVLGSGDTRRSLTLINLAHQKAGRP